MQQSEPLLALEELMMTMRIRIHLAALAVFSCVTGMPAAYAATATTTFNVTANVPNTCSVSAVELAFGSYIGTADVLDTTTVTVKCTSGLDYTVGLDDGLNYSACSSHRCMKHGTADYLNYELYSDSARTTRWGNVSGSWVSGSGTGADQTLTVYGLLPAGQTLIGGDYLDTIQVTVTYTP